MCPRGIPPPASRRRRRGRAWDSRNRSARALAPARRRRRALEVLGFWFLDFGSRSSGYNHKPQSKIHKPPPAASYRREVFFAAGFFALAAGFFAGAFLAAAGFFAAAGFALGAECFAAGFALEV